jgi:hypothetical protein
MNSIFDIPAVVPPLRGSFFGMPDRGLTPTATYISALRALVSGTSCQNRSLAGVRLFSKTALRNPASRISQIDFPDQAIIATRRVRLLNTCRIVAITLLLALLLPSSAKEAPKPLFAATVNGQSISLNITAGKFNPRQRKVSKRKGPDGPIVLLNGKPIVGTDNSEPPLGLSKRANVVIERIDLVWNGKPVAVPTSLFDHILFPSLETTSNSIGGVPELIFSLDPLGDWLIVQMKVGEGAGAAVAYWMLRSDGKHTLLSADYFANLP